LHGCMKTAPLTKAAPKVGQTIKLIGLDGKQFRARIIAVRPSEHGGQEVDYATDWEAGTRLTGCAIVI